MHQGIARKCQCNYFVVSNDISIQPFFTTRIRRQLALLGVKICSFVASLFSVNNNEKEFGIRQYEGGALQMQPFRPVFWNNDWLLLDFWNTPQSQHHPFYISAPHAHRICEKLPTMSDHNENMSEQQTVPPKSALHENINRKGQTRYKILRDC